jgi:hypothetical protein
MKKCNFVSYCGEYRTLNKSEIQTIFSKMNRLNLAAIVILLAGLLTTIGGYAVPVFAGGDGHDHHDTTCKHNDDNNCNSSDIHQDVYATNDCEVENENQDHSHDNENTNTLACSNVAQNNIGDFSIADLLNSIG